MTKENSEFDFKKLDDLVIQLELKEAIENGDMGQIAFCLKHMGIMINQLFEMTKGDWEEITEDVFRKIFKKSAVKRTKYNGLLRNIQFLKK